MKCKTIKRIFSLVIIVSVFMFPFQSNSFSYLHPSTKAMEKSIELDYTQCGLKMISNYHSLVASATRGINYFSFQYENKICSFMHYYDNENGYWVDELFRYDCENQKELPSITMKDFLGFDSSIMKIDGDTLVTSGMLNNKGSWLVSYSLKTGKTLWCEPADVVCRIGDNFLVKDRKPKSVVYSLLSGIDGSEIWKYSFSDYIVTFCGIDTDKNGFFKHDKSILSQIDLKNGAVMSETNISKNCSVFIKENYILLQHGFNIYECLQIDTKETLWKKQFKDYEQYFIYVDDKKINEYYWKGIMISEEEVLTYNDELIVVFNLTTGEKVKSYFIPEYSIVDILSFNEEGTYFFQISYAKNEYRDYSIFKTNLEINNDSSFLYEYSQEDKPYMYGRFDSCYSICGKTYFHQTLSWLPYAYISTTD